MSPESQTARRGRPQKWSSEAERKRAYRARKADELADPARLRLELREARTEIRRLERKAARLQRMINQAERATARERAARAELEEELVRRDNTLEFWKRRVDIVERQLSIARRPKGLDEK